MKTKTLMILSIFFILFMINFISSTSSWSQYGYADLPIRNEQPNGYGVLTYLKNISISQGYTADNSDIVYQPLVFYSAVSGKYYLAIQNGNYLQIYDKNLNLITEINTGNKTFGQIAEMNDAVNSKHHIYGWYNVNSSLIVYKDYYFNPSTELLSLNYSLDVYNADNPLLMSTRGVRCRDGLSVPYNTTCYSLLEVQNGSGQFNLILFQTWVNDSEDRGYISSSLNYQFYKKSTTPLSSVFFQSDKTLNYLAYTDEEIYVFDGSGDDVLFKTNTNSSSVLFAETTSSTYEDLIIINSSAVGKYRISDGSLVSSYATYCNPPVTHMLCSAIGDYNGDGYDDVFYSCSSSGSAWYYALKGSDLSVLGSGTQSVETGFSEAVHGNCIISKMNGLSPYYDIIYGSKYNLRIKSLFDDSFLLSRNSSTGSFGEGLAVADLDDDGFNDIITSSSGKTEIFFSNYTAQLPVLSSITYDPSTSILARTTLNIYIVASDSQGFPIQYGIKCSNSDSWVINTTSTKTCTYNNAGVYNLSISVGNTYRADSLTYSQAISVTETGSACNVNGVCESSLGETSETCPSDCPSGETTGGDLNIPLVLVNTENTEQGLLPEIYYGTLGFLSNVLKPLIILVFVIFFVLIMFAIGTIIKKIGKKVGS
jgi:hypothetical protein